MLLKIFLDDLKYEFCPLPADYRHLGGRGLIAKVISDKVPPEADPFSPENILVIAPGLFAGTSLPNSGRLSVGAKSPLTKTIKEANAGGYASYLLGIMGIRAIVLQGTSKRPVIVKIDRDNVNFISAEQLMGLGNCDLAKKLKSMFGQKIAIISIGPAGEKKLKAASLAVTTKDFRLRMAGRGGLGAIMGNKNVKAVVISHPEKRYELRGDPKKIKEIASKLVSTIYTNPMASVFRHYGTPRLLMTVNEVGGLPTRNFSMGQFEGARKISAEAIQEWIKNHPGSRTAHRCMPGCVIGCSNILTDGNGQELVSALEYETLGLVGANCMIDDLRSVALINQACNDLGVDTIEIGGALAMCMEAGLIKWGDGTSALNLVKGIGKELQAGTVIGNGCNFTAQALGVRRVPSVKGQCIPAYDPRVEKALGITYATSSMGADHTAGLVRLRPDQRGKVLSAKELCALSLSMQAYMAAMDTLGICMMASRIIDTPEMLNEIVSVISEITGERVDEQSYLTTLGFEVLKYERDYSLKAGVSPGQDTLPPFFYEEPLPPTNELFNLPREEINRYVEDFYSFKR